MDFTRSTESTTAGSEAIHNDAIEVFPGGVSHNFRYTEPYPLYIEEGEGAHIRDVDGNIYVDFWNGHAANILGHAHPSVVDAVSQQAAKGLHHGLLNEPILELGNRVPDYVPSAERLRFCVTGTEATMYAVRLARANTGRDHILKIDGGWHGGNTDLAVAAFSPFSKPTTVGLPPGTQEHVLSIPRNDKEAASEVFSDHHDEIAAVIVDPTMQGFEPDDEFMALLRDETEDRGALLVFDEIVSGFRLSPGSYQARSGIIPDLTTLGKILGGGMPVGAIAGRAELFERARPDLDIAPGSRVLAGGGTFSMNPMTAAAGLATLDVIENEPVYDQTESRARRLRSEFETLFDEIGVEGAALGTSSLFRPLLTRGALPTSGAFGSQVRKEATATFHRKLWEHGYYHPPSGMGNVSFQISDEHIDGMRAAAREVITTMTENGQV